MAGPGEKSPLEYPQLIDDIRYNPATASYWGSLGLEISDEYITITGPPQKANAPLSVSLWKNRPFTTTQGETRYKIYFGLFAGSLLESSTKRLIRENLQTLQNRVYGPYSMWSISYVSYSQNLNTRLFMQIFSFGIFY